MIREDRRRLYVRRVFPSTAASFAAREAVHNSRQDRRDALCNMLEVLKGLHSASCLTLRIAMQTEPIAWRTAIIALPIAPKTVWI